MALAFPLSLAKMIARPRHYGGGIASFYVDTLRDFAKIMRAASNRSSHNMQFISKIIKLEC
jgi:hypothetical protein